MVKVANFTLYASYHDNLKKKGNLRDSLAVQWLGLGTFTGRGTKILEAVQRGQKNKKNPSNT